MTHDPLRGDRGHVFIGVVDALPAFKPSAKATADGTQHDWFADYDTERTKFPETRGLSVIGFANAKVEGDLDSDLARIGEALRAPFN